MAFVFDAGFTSSLSESYPTGAGFDVILTAFPSGAWQSWFYMNFSRGGVRSQAVGAARLKAKAVGAVLVGVLGGPAAMAFTILHGAGNGILTIARGTASLAIFGSRKLHLRSWHYRSAVESSSDDSALASTFY